MYNFFTTALIFQTVLYLGSCCHNNPSRKIVALPVSVSVLFYGEDFYTEVTTINIILLQLISLFPVSYQIGTRNSH